MFIPIKIKRSTGKVVKSFMFNGAQNLESVMLWIWRDLFMAILATGSKRQRCVVPDMIDDIRLLLGWRALELLLRGGTSGRSLRLSSPASPSLFYEHSLNATLRTKKNWSLPSLHLTNGATLSTTTVTRITSLMIHPSYATRTFTQGAFSPLIGHGALLTNNHGSETSFTTPSSTFSKSHPQVQYTRVWSPSQRTKMRWRKKYIHS